MWESLHWCPLFLYSSSRQWPRYLSFFSGGTFFRICMVLPGDNACFKLVPVVGNLVKMDLRIVKSQQTCPLCLWPRQVHDKMATVLQLVEDFLNARHRELSSRASLIEWVGKNLSSKLKTALRRGARAAESACLESTCAGNGTVGSNPTLSAISIEIPESGVRLFIKCELGAGPCATESCEPRQIRKEATVSRLAWVPQDHLAPL